MTQTKLTWTEDLPEERDGYKIACVKDECRTYYAHVEESADHDGVAAAYAATADYSEFPVLLRVWSDRTGDVLGYSMDADRSVEWEPSIARTGGEAWQRPS